METRDDGSSIKCNEHPDAPHGFLRDASHNEGRYVCECEFWEPPEEKQKPVGYVSGFYGGYCVIQPTDPAVVLPVGMALYRAPTEWVGLTEQDVHDAFQFTELIKQLDFHRDRQEWCENFAAYIEAKLKEKNT